MGKYEEWFAAVIEGDTRAVARGIAGGLDVDARTNQGRTALMIAARHGHGDVVDALVAAGADVDATLYEAVLSEELEAPDLDHTYRVITEAAARIPASDAIGRRFARGFAEFISAIRTAGEEDAARTVEMRAVFVEPNEDDGFDPHELSTALCHAAAYGHSDAARRLVNAGADVDAPHWDCTPPLVHAAARGDLRMVGMLVGAGADVDAGFDVTPIEVAAERGHADVISRLLQAGAAADQTDENGLTPLMRAAEKGHLTAVHVLIQGGADPNVWEQGETPLLSAARNGHEDVVEYLEALVTPEVREWVRIEMRER